MRRISFAIPALVFSVATSPTPAQGFGIAPHVGTLGIGVDAAISLSRHLGVRGGVNYFPLTFDVEADGINYDIELASPQFTAMLDLHPNGGAFRLNGGVLVSSENVRLEATIQEPVEIGGTVYTPAQIGSVTGIITTKDVSPYVGIGFSNPGRRGTGFFLDLGVAFHGTPALSASAEGPFASDPVFLANLEQERRDIEEDIEPITIYPILALGLVIGF